VGETGHAGWGDGGRVRASGARTRRSTSYTGDIILASSKKRTSIHARDLGARLGLFGG